MSKKGKEMQSPIIPGFKVMKWLRGVREDNYKLSVENPQEYLRRRTEARKRMQCYA